MQQKEQEIERQNNNALSSTNLESKADSKQSINYEEIDKKESQVNSPFGKLEYLILKGNTIKKMPCITIPKQHLGFSLKFLDLSDMPKICVARVTLARFAEIIIVAESQYNQILEKSMYKEKDNL